MQINWEEALLYVTREPAWKRRVGVGGLLILVLPPFGWVLALGYRSLVGSRLIEGRSPILPDWRGNISAAFRRGAASSGVILGYLTPFVVAYWLLGAGSLTALQNHWRELAVFVAGAVILPPVAIPTFPVLFALRYEWLRFSTLDIGILLVIFLGPIWLLPAAFLQVARHHRFAAAFNAIAAMRLAAAAPRRYVEAWIVSLSVSAVAVLLVPLTPWLLFWSYLVISHVFLQTLAGADRVRARPRAPKAAA